MPEDSGGEDFLLLKELSRNEADNTDCLLVVDEEGITCDILLFSMGSGREKENND